MRVVEDQLLVLDIHGRTRRKQLPDLLGNRLLLADRGDPTRDHLGNQVDLQQVGQRRGTAPRDHQIRTRVEQRQQIRSVNHHHVASARGNERPVLPGPQHLRRIHLLRRHLAQRLVERNQLPSGQLPRRLRQPIQQLIGPAGRVKQIVQRRTHPDPNEEPKILVLLTLTKHRIVEPRQQPTPRRQIRRPTPVKHRTTTEPPGRIRRQTQRATLPRQHPDRPGDRRTQPRFRRGQQLQRTRPARNQFKIPNRGKLNNHRRNVPTGPINQRPEPLDPVLDPVQVDQLVIQRIDVQQHVLRADDCERVQHANRAQHLRTPTTYPPLIDEPERLRIHDLSQRRPRQQQLTSHALPAMVIRQQQFAQIKALIRPRLGRTHQRQHRLGQRTGIGIPLRQRPPQRRLVEQHPRIRRPRPESLKQRGRPPTPHQRRRMHNPQPQRLQSPRNRHIEIIHRKQTPPSPPHSPPISKRHRQRSQRLPRLRILPENPIQRRIKRPPPPRLPIKPAQRLSQLQRPEPPQSQRRPRHLIAFPTNRQQPRQHLAQGLHQRTIARIKNRRITRTQRRHIPVRSRQERRIRQQPSNPMPQPPVNRPLPDRPRHQPQQSRRTRRPRRNQLRVRLSSPVQQELRQRPRSHPPPSHLQRERRDQQPRQPQRLISRRRRMQHRRSTQPLRTTVLINRHRPRQRPPRPNPLLHRPIRQQRPHELPPRIHQPPPRSTPPIPNHTLARHPPISSKRTNDVPIHLNNDLRKLRQRQ
jgi:hypothetical protein